MSRSLIYHTQLTAHGIVTVTAMSGIEVSAELDQISKSGMTLQCNRETLDRLFPQTPTFSPKQTVQLDTCFGLAEVGKVESRCDVIAVRRLSRDTFELNLKFHTDNQRALVAIEHYVERKLRNKRRATVMNSEITEITRMKKGDVTNEEIRDVA